VYSRPIPLKRKNKIKSWGNRFTAPLNTWELQENIHENKEYMRIKTGMSEEKKNKKAGCRYRVGRLYRHTFEGQRLTSGRGKKAIAIAYKNCHRPIQWCHCPPRRTVFFNSAYWPSVSSKVDDFYLIWKGVCDFLLVNYSNLGPISHRFWDTATFSLKLFLADGDMINYYWQSLQRHHRQSPMTYRLATIHIVTDDDRQRDIQTHRSKGSDLLAYNLTVGPKIFFV